uniref:DNA repair protein RAD51 homolog 3 n=1 Tax=Romanomermis culicivorax TaxID=13658 RepID=A0A915J204_ROMCU
MNVAEKIEKPILTNAWQLLNDNSIDSIVTFCKRLDTILGGGIRLGQMTEIIAPAGCGKTQICFQSAVTCQIPICLGGVEGQVIYIDTENTFNTKRLEAIAQAVVEHCRSTISDGQKVLTAKSFTKENIFDRIHYKKCSTIVQLLDVCSRLETLVKRWNVKLVIVDSVAAPFRYNDSLPTEKNLDHLKFQQLLKMRLLQTAIRRNVAVIVTNHMTTR